MCVYVFNIFRMKCRKCLEYKSIKSHKKIKKNLPLLLTTWLTLQSNLLPFLGTTWTVNMCVYEESFVKIQQIYILMSSECKQRVSPPWSPNTTCRYPFLSNISKPVFWLLNEHTLCAAITRSATAANPSSKWVAAWNLCASAVFGTRNVHKKI